jgi:hypothetical protein
LCDDRFVSFRSPSLFYLLVHSRCRGFLFSFDHTQTHTTVGRTALDEVSARRRDLYLTTHSQQEKMLAPSGIRTHDPSKRSAADVRLRPRGHWDRDGRTEFNASSLVIQEFFCGQTQRPVDVCVIRGFVNKFNTLVILYYNI